MSKKKELTLSIIGVLTLVVIVIGSSYAYYVARTNSSGTGANVDVRTATLGDTTVTTEGSIGFSDTNIYPGHKNISKIKVTATGDKNVLYNLTWTGTNTLNTPLKYYVYKTTTEETPTITCTKKEEGTIETHLYEECVNNNFDNLGNIVKEGTIETSEASSITKLIKNEEIQATSTGSTIYYYIVLEYENTESEQNIDMNGTFNGVVNTTLLEKKEGASDYLIAKGGMVEENGYRYEGANPNNYVTFNNELWRIIGVFDVENSDTKETENLVKLIRNESIGDIAWDSNNANDWTTSSLKTILNDGDYYNRIGSYSTIGLTSESKVMIQSVKWNLGGTTISSLTAEQFYTAERGIEVYSGHATEWNGYVGLMYPSDYGHAVDSASCPRTTVLYDYYGTTSCHENNWLFNSYEQWTLAPNSSDSYNAFSVNNYGSVRIFNADYGCGARPSIYLKSSVQIVEDGNDGSLEHPYNLSM